MPCWKTSKATIDDGLSEVTDNYLQVGLREPHALNQWVLAAIT